MNGANQLFLFVIGIIAVICSGCVSFPREGDYVECGLEPKPIERVPTADIENASLVWLKSISSDMSRCNVSNDTFQVLSISGGGPDGAFGAGFIASRLMNPDEDLHPCLVTGVSTGAVMGSYVYLATSKNAERRNFGLSKLQTFYQGLDDKDLVSKHWLLALPFNVSVYDVSGIRNMLKKEVGADLLRMIKDEYEFSNRHFAIGATNIQTGAFEIIDLTEYVSRNGANISQPGVQMCYQEAIRASAAIPLAFPPVAIKEQQEGKDAVYKVYSDGGVRHMMFINAKELMQLVGSKEVQIYGVVNNTFDISGMKQKVTITEGALQNMKIAMDQLYMDSAYAVDTAMEESETVEHYWASLVDDGSGSECASLLDGKLFNPKYQDCLYKMGFALAKQKGWSSEPWPIEIFQ